MARPIGTVIDPKRIRARGGQSRPRKSLVPPVAPPKPKRFRGVTLAECEKYSRQVLQGYDPQRDSAGCWFDAAEAKRYLDFFPRYLVHVKGGKGSQPFILEDWQKWIVANGFGWKKPGEPDQDGNETPPVRRYGTIIIFVPKKNGKTPLAAGLVAAQLILENEPGGEYYSLASTRAQAGLVWSWARGMLQRNQETESKLEFYQHAIIKKDDELTNYKSASAEAGGMSGANIQGAVIDEVQEIPDRDLIAQVEESTLARRQPLIIFIYHAGWDQESVGFEKYLLACNVRDGVFPNASLLPLVYEAKPEDDWKDEDTWHRANPNLGVSKSLVKMRESFEKAVREPEAELFFKRNHLNIWTAERIQFIDIAKWDECGKIPFPSEAELRAVPCYAGLDMASSRDLVGFSLIWKLGADRIAVRVHCFLSGEGIEGREKRDAVPYREWAKAGLATINDGPVIDTRVVEDAVKKAHNEWHFRECGFDPAYGASVATQLLNTHGVPMIEVKQNKLHLSEPSVRLRNAVLNGKLIHGGNPMLRWQAANTKAIVDPLNELIKLTKATERQRIDGIVSTVIALRLAGLKAESNFIYSQRGLRSMG